jgi:hypothetical protein
MSENGDVVVLGPVPTMPVGPVEPVIFMVDAPLLVEDSSVAAEPAAPSTFIEMVASHIEPKIEIAEPAAIDPAVVEKERKMLEERLKVRSLSRLSHLPRHFFCPPWVTLSVLSYLISNSLTVLN